MAYIKGTRSQKVSDVLEVMRGSLKHEKMKQPFYPKWRLGFDIYNSMYGDKSEIAGMEQWKVLDPSFAEALNRPQVINMIVPWVKYMSGVMTQATFTKLVPEVYTDQNVEQTKIWDDTLWYYYRQCNLYRDIYSANLLRFTGGDGHVILTWDADANQDCHCYAKWQRAREQALLDPEITSEGMALLEEDYDPDRHCMCTGSLRSKVRSSVDIIPNQEALTDKDMIWFIDRERVEIERAREIFSQTGEGFLGGGRDLEVMHDATIEGQPRASSGLSAVHMFYEGAEDTTTVIERRWHRASSKYPRGRLSITGMNANVGLYDYALPYNQVHRLPHFRFFNEPVPGHYWSNTNAFRVIIPQLDSNEFLHKFKKVIKNHAMAKPFLDRKANVTEDWTNDEEDICEYDGEAIQGRPPAHYLSYPNPSMVYSQTLSWYKEEMAGILNFHGMQTGNYPKELRSTQMLETALEEMNKQIRPIAENDVYTLNSMYSFMLPLISENQPDSFFEKFTGKSRGRYMYSLSDSFRDIPYKVHTEVRSVFDMSLMMKTQRLERLLKMGLIRPDESDELRKILAETGGGFDSLEELNRPGEINAYDENERFMVEGIINNNNNQPYPFENNRSHFRIHSKMVETARFRELPPEATAPFFQHIQMTQEKIMEQEMQAAEMNRMRHANIGTQPAQGGQGGEVPFGEAGAPE